MGAAAWAAVSHSGLRASERTSVRTSVVSRPRRFEEPQDPARRLIPTFTNNRGIPALRRCRFSGFVRFPADQAAALTECASEDAPR